MSIETLQAQMSAEVEAFRAEVAEHLRTHPMGEQYFGMKAASNPRLVARLRDGGGVLPHTIAKVRKFMRSREAEADQAEAS